MLAPPTHLHMARQPARGIQAEVQGHAVCARSPTQVLGLPPHQPPEPPVRPTCAGSPPLPLGACPWHDSTRLPTIREGHSRQAEASCRWRRRPGSCACGGAALPSASHPPDKFVACVCREQTVSRLQHFRRFPVFVGSSVQYALYGCYTCTAADTEVSGLYFCTSPRKKRSSTRCVSESDAAMPRLSSRICRASSTEPPRW